MLEPLRSIWVAFDLRMVCGETALFPNVGSFLFEINYKSLIAAISCAML